ncbi:hypothetical protein CHUAL_002025 [Chamberlinius hualienensis]
MPLPMHQTPQQSSNDHTEVRLSNQIVSRSMADSMAAPDSTGACCSSPTLVINEEAKGTVSVTHAGQSHTNVATNECTPQPRPNQVRTVMLTGVPIVALVIEGKDRLCLAQISNTLLKGFSYNEIHNRRVALGITCVQCTPVQLEILRRAGAMPISSRRCGMITKREAERLCRSFLGENAPPKLPDNFSFDVSHECAWGSRGSFLPSRYNSSRAKCIKCYYCNMFFSPNKFIFHSHRLPDSKYIQPDAANFNSWRRHLKLTGSPPMDVRYAWEDVKAMFNGGSRKRVCTSSRISTSSSSMNHSKRPRPHLDTNNAVEQSPSRCGPDSGSQQPITSTSPYNFPCYPPNKVFGPNPYAPRPTLPPSCAPFVDWRATKPVNFSPTPNPYSFLHWPPPRHPIPPPPPPVISSPGQVEEGNGNDYRDMDSNSESSSRYDSEQESNRRHRRRSLSSCSEADFRSSDNEENAMAGSGSGGGSGRRQYNESPTVYSTVDKPVYCSAFRPVVQRSSVHSVESLIRPSSSSLIRENKISVSPCKTSSTSINSESIDVELTDDATTTPTIASHWTTNQPIQVKDADDEEEIGEQTTLASSSSSSSSSAVVAVAQEPQIPQATPIQPHRELDSAQLAALSKDELEELLLVESAARKRAESKCDLIKENLEEQMKREAVYREDMTKQLEIVKETLCNELDQERKARFAILQKLKEAHDALHHFSCKVLIPRHCADCSYKPIIPQ